MPELPDVTLYVEALERQVRGQVLKRLTIKSPSLLRSVDPPIFSVEGKTVVAIRRLGKRLILGLEDELFLVLHLMISGRLRWKAPGTKVPAKVGLAAFAFDHGTLVLTEASSRKRASLHLVRGEEALAAHDPGGASVFTLSSDEFKDRLTEENHTLKRVLTDPRVFDGIGNAYSDEILHHARLSPIAMSQKLDDDAMRRLHESAKETLRSWTERHRARLGEGFPDKVTAFHPDMAAHGKFGQPCPVCTTPIQRIAYADNETNYCPTCQTKGKLLADRSLSRLMKSDWPKTLEAFEELKRKHRGDDLPKKP